MNHACTCQSLDRERLFAHLQALATTTPELPALFAERPHLIAPVALFVPESDLATMRAVVAAVERLASTPQWAALALADAPPLARVPSAARGVLMGFDFHLTERGPQLIEINTNAGGVMINAVIRAAQRACCPELAAKLEMEAAQPLVTEKLLAMFRAEWARCRGSEPLTTIAIVDDAPKSQYLYPEFLLFRELFHRAGYRAVIADATALTASEGRLWAMEGSGRDAVDLVYNRLTDFALTEPHHAALAEALASATAVVTPHPRAHALLADKRRLVTLSDEAALVELGVDGETRALLLAHVPATLLVTPANAATLWTERRAFFFKPVAGYGSKAAYRGDKVTRRVWEEVITAGDYVAQAYAAPAVRPVPVAGEEGAPLPLKFDVRAYAYGGEVLLFAARLYAGQTTNFRTVGGGFAPVFAA
ncbi:hypothetical protein JCM16106_18700 [Hydrogenophilus islandicus]